MQLLIKPTPVKVPKNSYVIEYETMQGDADGYTQNTVGPFFKGVHEEALESILLAFKGLTEKFPFNGSSREYLKVPEFVGWFYDIDSMENFLLYSPQIAASFNFNEDELAAIEKSINLAMATELFPMWPYDSLSADGTFEALKKWGVFYYDENGLKHEVEVKW